MLEISAALAFIVSSVRSTDATFCGSASLERETCSYREPKPPVTAQGKGQGLFTVL